jgi:hypothetical protein
MEHVFSIICVFTMHFIYITYNHSYDDLISPIMLLFRFGYNTIIEYLQDQNTRNFKIEICRIKMIEICRIKMIEICRFKISLISFFLEFLSRRIGLRSKIYSPLYHAAS